MRDLSSNDIAQEEYSSNISCMGITAQGAFDNQLRQQSRDISSCLSNQLMSHKEEGSQGSTIKVSNELNVINEKKEECQSKGTS
jgi:hypothetical protein